MVQETNEKRVATSQDQFNEILGYMPLREDFDVEYDNEAELFLAEMEFNGSPSSTLTLENEQPAETDLKNKIMNIYNKRLDERLKRK